MKRWPFNFKEFKETLYLGSYPTYVKNVLLKGEFRCTRVLAQLSPKSQRSFVSFLKLRRARLMPMVGSFRVYHQPLRQKTWKVNVRPRLSVRELEWIIQYNRFVPGFQIQGLFLNTAYIYLLQHQVEHAKKYHCKLKRVGFLLPIDSTNQPKTIFVDLDKIYPNKGHGFHEEPDLVESTHTPAKVGWRECQTERPFVITGDYAPFPYLQPVVPKNRPRQKLLEFLGFYTRYSHYIRPKWIHTPEGEPFNYAAETTNTRYQLIARRRSSAEEVKRAYQKLWPILFPLNWCDDVASIVPEACINTRSRLAQYFEFWDRVSSTYTYGPYQLSLTYEILPRGPNKRVQARLMSQLTQEVNQILWEKVRILFYKYNAKHHCFTPRIYEELTHLWRFSVKNPLCNAYLKRRYKTLFTGLEKESVKDSGLDKPGLNQLPRRKKVK